MHHRPCSLEDGDAAEALGKLFRGINAVGLDDGGGGAKQTSRFAGMRREDPVLATHAAGGDKVQRIGIDDQRLARSHRSREDRLRPRVLAESRSHGDQVDFLEERA